MQIKIRGLPGGRRCAAEWQLACSPRALGRRGQNLINTRYVEAETLDGALKAATAEAERMTIKPACGVLLPIEPCEGRRRG